MATWDNTSWGVQSLPKDSIPKIQTNLDYLYNSIGGSSDVVAQIAAKAPLASPNFTGTVTLPSTTMTGAINENSVIMESASTVAIGASAGNTIRITGTTTITAFDIAQAGTKRTLIFTDALTVTYGGSSIILPGSVSITTTNADIMEFVSLGGGIWRCTNYLPYNKTSGYSRLSNGSMYHHKDLASYNSEGTPDIGTIKITLPSSWSSTMFTIRLTGYNHNLPQTQTWTAELSGYNPSSNWTLTNATLSPTCNFNSVRFGHDGTNCCILLGTTTTSWYHPKVILTDVFAMFTNATKYSFGWGISLITDETGITVSSTPTPTTIASLGGGNYIGAINENLVTIASASTLNIGAQPANYIIVTGTTNISAFDSAQPGTKRQLRFSNSLTVVYSSNMLLPGGVNIAVVAGDVMEFVSGGSGLWRCTKYQPWNGNFIKNAINTSSGSIYLTNSGSTVVSLQADSSGSLELGDIAGTATVGTKTPYIDFHYAVGSAQDYNIRQINGRDGAMIFSGTATNAVEICCYGLTNGTRHGFMLGNFGSYGYLDYDTSGSQVRLSALNNLVFGFNNAAAHNTTTFTERMRIASGGNVSIGTTSVINSAMDNGNRTILSVKGKADFSVLELGNGNIGVSGNAVGLVSFSDSNITGSDKRIASIAGVLDGTTASNMGGKLQFVTKADNGVVNIAMVLDASGRCGLGTASPQANLHNTGSTIWGAGALSTGWAAIGNSQVSPYINESSSTLDFSLKTSSGLQKIVKINYITGAITIG